MTMNKHQRAQTWRIGLGLSRRELAEMTGYSQSSIVSMERGTTAAGEPIDEGAWQRYRMACAAVAAGVTGWNWGSVTMTFAPSRPKSAGPAGGRRDEP